MAIFRKLFAFKAARAQGIRDIRFPAGRTPVSAAWRVGSNGRLSSRWARTDH